jgi:hypothetical protein
METKSWSKQWSSAIPPIVLPSETSSTVFPVAAESATSRPVGASPTYTRLRAGSDSIPQIVVTPTVPDPRVLLRTQPGSSAEASSALASTYDRIVDSMRRSSGRGRTRERA